MGKRPQISSGADQQYATRNALDNLRCSVGDLRTEVDGLNGTVQAITGEKGPWSKVWAERNFVATLLGVLMAMVLALFGGAGWVFSLYLEHAFDAHLKAVEQRLDSLSERVAKIEGRTEAAALVQSDLDRIAQQPKGEFEKNLPFVGRVLSSARAGDVPIPRRTVSALKSRLAESDRNAPGFWNAAASVIDYVAPTQPTTLPPCYDRQPTVGSLNVGPSGKVLSFGYLGPTWMRCLLDLNAPVPAQIQRAIDSMSVGGLATVMKVACERCQIRYSGGPVPLLEERIKKLILVGCAFDFAPNATPSKSGEHVIIQLLNAADLSHVELQPRG